MRVIINSSPQDQLSAATVAMYAGAYLSGGATGTAEYTTNGDAPNIMVSLVTRKSGTVSMTVWKSKETINETDR